MKIFKKMKTIVYRDIACESESNDLFVLIRIQTLIDIVYSFFLFIIFFFGFNWHIRLMTALIGLTYLIVFNMTFKCSSRIILLLYCIISTYSTFFYCLDVSAGLGFRFVIFTIIPLIYFKTDESHSFRLFFSILCGLFSVGLAVTGLYVHSPWIIPNVMQIILICITTIVLTGKLMVSAHFFYSKFASDESKIIRYSQKLEKLATLDPLTQLQNRRGMEEYLSKKINSTDTSSKLFSLVICDIDFFKKVNDTYGHEAGDYVLTVISNILKDYMKDKGCVARWGGEEFLLIFESINGDDAFVYTEEIRHKISKAEIKYNDITINITMTFGLEEFSIFSTIDEAIKKADEKLYSGKSSGRNKVVY